MPRPANFFFQPAPLGLSTTSGPTGGGNTIPINGTNLIDAAQVFFGTVPADGFTAASNTTITVTVPAQAAGPVDVTVVTPYGVSTTSSADQFTFVAPVPAVTGVGPSSGTTTGGTAVTLWGSGFRDATQVWFGGVAASAFTVISDTESSATSPESALVGVVDVQVSTQYGGTSPVVPADQYTCTLPPAPEVSGVNPSSGKAAGGTSVTLSGSALTGGTAEVWTGGPVNGYVLMESAAPRALDCCTYNSCPTSSRAFAGPCRSARRDKRRRTWKRS